MQKQRIVVPFLRTVPQHNILSLRLEEVHFVDAVEGNPAQEAILVFSWRIAAARGDLEGVCVIDLVTTFRLDEKEI